MKVPAQRLVLYGGSDSRRELAELSFGVDVDGSVDADSIPSTIHSVIRERKYSELEDLALALAHRLLDSETGITRAQVEVVAQSWRRLGARAFERGSSEVRKARATVKRDGSAAVEAAIAGLTLMMGDNEFITVAIEWRYKKAGVSYNSSWSAVRKLALQAFDDREEPEAIAQLLVDVIQTIAEVRVIIDAEPLEDSGGIFELSGEIKRRTASATAR